MPLIRLRRRRADGRAVVHTDIVKERQMRATRANVRANPDILMEIASYLDLQSLSNWRKTSPEVDAAVSCHLNHEYNKMLAKWFSNTDGFRAMLRLTDSVISGLASLRFLQRTGPVDWKAQDLDIYTPFSSALRMVLYLIVVENYELNAINRPTYHSDAKGFHRVYHLSKNGRSIDVIQSVTLSALHPLPFFWGLHVVTFLTADDFCLPYPTLTLQFRGVLNPISLIALEYPCPRTLECIQKYEARGYKFHRSPAQWTGAQCEQDHEACPRVPHYFGDKYCLVGSFYANTTPRIPCRAGCMPVWWRGGQPCDQACDDADPFERFAFPTVETLRIQDAIRLAMRW